MRADGAADFEAMDEREVLLGRKQRDGDFAIGCGGVAAEGLREHERRGGDARFAEELNFLRARFRADRDLHVAGPTAPKRAVGVDGVLEIIGRVLVVRHRERARDEIGVGHAGAVVGEVGPERGIGVVDEGVEQGEVERAGRDRVVAHDVARPGEAGVVAPRGEEIAAHAGPEGSIFLFRNRAGQREVQEDFAQRDRRGKRIAGITDRERGAERHGRADAVILELARAAVDVNLGP